MSKDHSHSFYTTGTHTNMIYHYWCRPWFPDWSIFFIFPHSKVTHFFPPCTLFFGRFWHTQPTFEWWGVMLQKLLDYWQVLFVILLHGNFVSSTFYLFNHLFISVWTPRHLFYVSGYNSILLCWFCCWDIPEMRLLLWKVWFCGQPFLFIWDIYSLWQRNSRQKKQRYKNNSQFGNCYWV